MLKSDSEPSVRDAGLIAAAQKVEHYEIAAYGTLRTFAEFRGDKQAAQSLQETLDEEYEADKTLTQVAESSINVQAAERGPGRA
jgi:ferritin-like metal-binding protein YciE